MLLMHVQAKEFAELAASVAQLSRRVARVTGAPGALTDTERALAAAQVWLCLGGRARGRRQVVGVRVNMHHWLQEV
jgi:hypothetical protein